MKRIPFYSAFLNLVKYYRKKEFNSRNVVILGGGIIGDEIRANLITDYSFGFKYLGMFDDKLTVAGTLPVQIIDNIPAAPPSTAIGFAPPAGDPDGTG